MKEKRFYPALISYFFAFLCLALAIFLIWVSLTKKAELILLIGWIAIAIFMIVIIIRVLSTYYVFEENNIKIRYFFYKERFIPYYSIRRITKKGPGLWWYYDMNYFINNEDMFQIVMPVMGMNDWFAEVKKRNPNIRFHI